MAKFMACLLALTSAVGVSAAEPAEQARQGAPKSDRQVSTETRLISLRPAITEILYALGAGDQIVGVTDFCNYPRQALIKKKIGGYANPSIEKIIELKPSLVLLSDDGVDNVSESLRRAGLKFEVLPLRKLSDYEPTVRRLGEITGNARPAQNLINKWNLRLKSIMRSSQKLGVLIQVENNPLMVAGTDSYFAEALELCGPTEILPKVTGYPRVQIESLKGSSLGAVVVTLHDAEKRRNEIFDFWKNQKVVNLKPDQILFVNSDHMSRLTPRFPAAARSLCQRLLPLRKP